jgi:hypothetical protein
LLSLDGKAMGCWLKVGNGRARWARLYSLAVHPALRGQGWGKRLIEAGFMWMQQEQLSTCRAEVKAGNRAARKLYAGCGFQEVGLLRDYYASGVMAYGLAHQYLTNGCKASGFCKLPTAYHSRLLEVTHVIEQIIDFDLAGEFPAR